LGQIFWDKSVVLLGINWEQNEQVLGTWWELHKTIWNTLETPKSKKSHPPPFALKGEKMGLFSACFLTSLARWDLFPNVLVTILII
jgi:hypothetical protein